MARPAFGADPVKPYTFGQAPSKPKNTLPPIVLPPKVAKGGKKTLSYAELRSLWIQAGGDPTLASTMAAIALAESGGRIDALNDNPKTGDYSVGPWQINYYGTLRGDRVARFGSPEQLRKDALANAKAAVAIQSGGGLTPWSTYRSGAYTAFLRPQTPEEKAAAKKAQAQADLTEPGLVDAQTQLSLAKSQAIAVQKAVQHIGDPWVTVNRDRSGRVTGFGTATGENPPANTLMQGGQPLTKSQLDQMWSSRYESIFEAYTGKMATPAEIADVVGSGLSTYAVQQRLAGIDPKSGKYTPNPAFTQSPSYKSSASAIIERAKETLGHAPSAAYVAKAIAYGWSEADQDAELMKLPTYEKGPKFTAAVSTNRAAYQQVYGTPDQAGTQWLHEATKNGWTQQQVAEALRAAPEYVHSPEYANNAADFLDSLGLLTRSRQSALVPVAKKKGALGPTAPLAPVKAAA